MPVTSSGIYGKIISLILKMAFENEILTGRCLNKQPGFSGEIILFLFNIPFQGVAASW